jgi:hypothetical protein
MRMMMDVRIPNGKFNALVKEGTAGAKLAKILEAIKPEAAYFSARHGSRGGYFIVEVADPSKIPALAEPWFLTFDATVDFHIIMNPDELKHAGLDELGKKWA